MDFIRENIIPLEVLVQICAFLIVFFVLKATAWKPTLRALDMRRTRIREDFEKIEEAKKEIEALKAEYQGHLQRIEDEARQKIQDAVAEGRRLSRKLQEKARQDAGQVLDQSKTHVALEIEKARLTLKNEIADLALLISTRIMEEEISDSLHHKKAVAILDELEKKL